MCMKTDVKCMLCRTIFQSYIIMCGIECRTYRVQIDIAQCPNCVYAIVGHQTHKISAFDTFKRSE